MGRDYDTKKYTDKELVDELGEVPGRPYRSPAYFDALRQEVKRRDLKVPAEAAEAELCACGAPLVWCDDCGDLRCLSCDPYDGDLKVPSAETPPAVEQGPPLDIPPAAGAAPAAYRLWVNMKGTILVRMWDSGAVEVALRDATWETWRPPETLFEEKV